MYGAEDRHNPYVGPRPYSENEAIYGRDQEARQLFEILVAERIVLLHSPSGAGKTSLVQAGLLPRLRKHGFQVLPIVRLNRAAENRPNGGQGSNRYLDSLRYSLEEYLPDEARPEGAPEGDLSLAAFLGGLRPPFGPEARLVLIFDQFEEILTQDSTDIAAKTAFFEAVGEALHNPRLWALFVIREDYLGALDPYLGKIPTRLARRYRIDLLGMKAAEEAIRKPAEVQGVVFTRDAILKLVDDLRRVQVQQPDGSMIPSLGPYIEPVQLQVVCHRLWNQLQPGQDTISPGDLDTIGNVDQSLGAYYAERVEEISKETQVKERLVREWFADHLITKKGSRSQVRREKDQSGGLDNWVILKLIDAHLVRAEERVGSTWYELAHDRLVGPVQQDNEAWFRDHLSVLQRQADVWDEEKRPDGLLLRGQTLDEADEWANTHQDELIEREIAFLEASKEKRKIRQDAVKRKQLRNRMFLLLGLLMLSLVLVAVFWSDARDKTRQSNIRQLVDQSEVRLDDRLDQALLLGVEAHRMDPDGSGGRGALLAALEQEPQFAAFLRGHETPVKSLAVSPDGGILASGDEKGQVLTWRVFDPYHPSIPSALRSLGGETLGLRYLPGGQILAVSRGSGSISILKLDPAGQTVESAQLGLNPSTVSSMALAPDGGLAAFGTDSGRVELWDIHDLNQVQHLDSWEGPAPDYPEFGEVHCLAFSVGGTLLAAGGGIGPGMVLLWDLNRPSAELAEPVPLTEHRRTVWSLAFRPDDLFLASGDGDGMIRLWDLRDQPISATQPITSTNFQAHTGPVMSLAFNRGFALASGGEDQLIKLWPSGGPSIPGNYLTLFTGHSEAVTHLAFDRSGNTLFSAGSIGPARVWVVDNSHSALQIGLFGGHKGAASPLSFILDGKLAAAGDTQGSLGFWDLTKRETPVRYGPFAGHSGPIRAIAYQPDRQLLATGSEDKTIRLWDLSTVSITQTQSISSTVIAGLEGAAHSLAFHPQGRFLAGGDASGTVSIWEVSGQGAADPVTAVQRSQIKLPATVVGLAFSAAGERLLAVDEKGGMLLAGVADPAAIEPIAEIAGQADRITSVAFSLNGNLAAVGSATGQLFLYTASPNQAPLLLGEQPNAHAGGVLALAFHADGEVLVTSGEDGAVRIWGTSTEQPLAPLDALPPANQGRVTSLAFHPDGNILASGSEAGLFRLWRVKSPEEIPLPVSLDSTVHTRAVRSIAFSPIARMFASGGRDNTIRFWQIEDQGQLAYQGYISIDKDGAVCPATECSVLGLAYSSDGAWLAAGIEDGRLCRWDVGSLVNPKLDCQKDAGGAGSSVRSVAFDSIGRIFAAGSGTPPLRGFISFWGPGAGSLTQFGRLPGGANAVSIDPNGKLLAAVGELEELEQNNGYLSVWDVESGSQVALITETLPTARAVAFHPSDNLLATAHLGGDILLWQIDAQGALTRFGLPLTGQPFDLYSLAFSSDGELLAAGGVKGEILIWDVSEPARPALLGQVNGHLDSVRGLFFSANGKILGSGSADRTIHLWNVAIDAWPGLACRRAGRGLTPEEWEHFLPFERGNLETCGEFLGAASTP